MWIYEVKQSPQNHPPNQIRSSAKSVKFLVGFKFIGTSWPKGKPDDYRKDKQWPVLKIFQSLHLEKSEIKEIINFFRIQITRLAVLFSLVVTLRTDAGDAETNPYPKGGVHSVAVTRKCGVPYGKHCTQRTLVAKIIYVNKKTTEKRTTQKLRAHNISEKSKTCQKLTIWDVVPEALMAGTNTKWKHMSSNPYIQSSPRKPMNVYEKASLFHCPETSLPLFPKQVLFLYLLCWDYSLPNTEVSHAGLNTC